jgi:tRNA threonylcarbamoyladenosine biosynthesis protein TsaB
VNIVAIETATETVGVAVRNVDGAEAEFTLTGRRRHVESLTPALQHLLGQVGLRAPDIGVVAVDVGPGLFTGLRVGVSAAKGLAQALGIGVVGLSSLDVLLEASVRSGQSGLVLAGIDARRGEVFAAIREVGHDGVAIDHLAAGLFGPEALLLELQRFAGRTIHAVGDGSVRYAEQLASVEGVTVQHHGLTFPPPSVLLSLAAQQLADGRAPVPAAEVVPIYMRAADAVSNFAQIKPT